MKSDNFVPFGRPSSGNGMSHAMAEFVLTKN